MYAIININNTQHIRYLFIKHLGSQEMDYEKYT